MPSDNELVLICRGIPQSASMIPEQKLTQPVTKGGWVDPAPMSPPRGWGWGPRPEERIAQQQEAERREIERRIGGDDGPKIESEYNPFSRKWLEK